MTTRVRAADEGCRAATEADLPRLAELAAQAVEELRVGRGGEVWSRATARRPPYADRLADEVRSARHHVVVGTLDGDVLGYGVVRIDQLPDGGLLGVITDLYTEPGGRSVGIGEAAMDALIAWCREAGCFGVDSLALPGDRHTKNFFESFGLVARAIVVHRSLS
ncbi:MAG: GNAT family N-acetyltransferase [Acidimicrobiales bacterium]|nr:GNAT family N-acetyltransferase [Acidimicrobiales bacterium]